MSPTRKRSSVWMHFVDKGFERAECNICKSNISIKAGSTFNLRRHLRARHPNVQEAEQRQCSPDADQEKDEANVAAANTSFAFVNVTLEDGDSGGIATVTEKKYSVKPVEQTARKEASDNPPVKRTQHRRSLIWRHFQRLDSLNAAQCGICMKKVQCFKYGSTSNLRRHMSKRHPKVFSDLEANEAHETPLNSTQDSSTNNGTQGTFHATEQKSFQACDDERRVFRRERELIDALRRTQKEEALTLQHQRELLEKLRAANAREAAAEREEIESLRKAQQEEAKDLERQREELQKEKEELQKEKEELQNKWKELEQEKEELLLFSRAQ
ncbi:zinc finger BED domain-containing protein [Mugil cephalus]|uniref:zinc finger BED domain-containing protein n=1 Tax=Mugil cephalus TaxID=48193 RepID=UPI001FB79DF4|nr:zinc finger BED domain-containing protein [Mugil cephalus]